MKVEMAAYWLKLPLIFPYKLSFATVTEYDSIIFTVKTGERMLWGEATALPGYSWETAKSIWQEVFNSIQCAGDNLEFLRDHAMAILKAKPFAASAILTALDKMNKKLDRMPKAQQKVPLAGFVKGQTVEEAVPAAKELIHKGYRTLKVKLSKDVNNDVNRVKALQAIIGPKAVLRLDANQAYDYEMARYFLREVNPYGIELLEQPFPRDAWDWTESVVREGSIPVMLDESIWTEEDLSQAIRCGVDFVKFKLVKNGGIQNTIRLIKSAQRGGIKIILGNGVQTDLGCMDEYYIYQSTGLTYAGEMSGFLKLCSPLVPFGIRVEHDMMHVSMNDSKASIPKEYVFQEHRSQ